VPSTEDGLVQRTAADYWNGNPAGPGVGVRLQGPWDTFPWLDKMAE